MPNEYEFNVIITKHPTYWSWKVEHLGQFVASGRDVSLGYALRNAQMSSADAGYEVGEWCFVESFEADDVDHLIYGAYYKHSIHYIEGLFWGLWVLVAMCLLVIQLGYMIF